MAETLKEARIRAAVEQAERVGGVTEPFARMLVDKIQRILADAGDDVLPACSCGRCDGARRASLPPAQQMMMFM